MRYERPQRGREREFWQLNVDIFGDDGVSAEAEIISMADAIMKATGAKPDDYVIKINNRKLINFMMAQYLGLDAIQAQIMIKLLDRRNKISEQDFSSQAMEIFGDQYETLYPKINLGWAELRGIRTNQWKYIRAPRPELYDLNRDPLESKNVLAEHASEVRMLEAQLAAASHSA